MPHPRSTCGALIVVTVLLCCASAEEDTRNLAPVNVLSLGTQTGNTCFTQNFKQYYPGTTMTLNINPGVAIKSLNCFSQTPLLPVSATVSSGAINTNTMTVLLSTTTAKLFGSCTATC